MYVLDSDMGYALHCSVFVTVRGRSLMQWLGQLLMVLFFFVFVKYYSFEWYKNDIVINLDIRE